MRLATPADLRLLPAVERAADTVFDAIGIGPLPGPAPVEELAAAAAVLVSGDPPVGFARLEIVDGQAHLEQLSVLPTATRSGVGTALLEAAVEWAREQGYDWLTLITFRDVEWNAPFYAARGCAPVPEAELGPGLQEHRRIEREVDGMDAMGARLVMRRRLRP